MFIDASAPSQNFPENLSFYLVSVTSAGNAIGRLAGGVLGDQFGTCPLPSWALTRSPTSRPSRLDQCHDTYVFHRRRDDVRMAVHTWDSRALYSCGDLRSFVRRNADPHGRTDDGAR